MKNKHMWTWVVVLTVIVWVCACADKNKIRKSDPTPNFLVIIADDAGWNDVGYHGAEIITPNIDFLAQNGVRLNRFYVNPACSPSRASFLTGMPASRIGIVAPIGGRSEKSLPDSVRTLPQVLKEVNYETALFGKWHLGLKPASGPSAYGFDYSYGFLHGQIDQYTHHYKNGDESWHRNGKYITEKGHATDLITDEAVSWLEKKRDTSKSFFLQLAYSAPHFPLQEEEKWKTPYRSIIKDSSRVDFAAAMAHMDHSIGKVLETVRENGLEDNTIILFFSDNGGMEDWYPTDQYEGAHGPNDVLGSNIPLRDWKTSNYEGGIRVPGIVYWKDQLHPAINDSYISVIDLMPTLLSLSGTATIPKTIEGKNVWKAIKGEDELSDRLVYVRGHKQESLIKKPWKLIRTRHRGGASPDFEMYNVEKDPEEKNNVYDDEPNIAQELKNLLRKEFANDAAEVNAGIN